MDPRFSLRFESGERTGETVPIQGEVFTVGRRPGHTLQILDNSVSGKHAEITVDEQGAVLRDVGSTNGTRVGGERVIETRLVNGARIHFGNVELVFLDAAIGGRNAGTSAPAAAPAPVAATGGFADALLRLSPEVLARARKSSLVGVPALVGLLLLVGGAAFVWFKYGRAGADAGPSSRPAVQSADNLLGADYSFEAETDGWQAADGAPAAFLRGAQGRVSGGLGLVVDLAPGDWALHRSREVRAEAGRALAARMMLSVEGGATAQIGIELLPAGASGAGDGAAPANAPIAWSPPLAGSDRGFEAVEITTLVPPGYDAARMLVLGRAGGTGTVSADDAELAAVAGDALARPVAIHDCELYLLGAPARAAVLTRFGKPLLSLVAFAEGSTVPETAAAAPMTASAEASRVVLDPGSAGTAVCLRAEPALVRAGLATISADGYSTHGLDYVRANATSLLVGKGAELVRVLFAGPVTLEGVAEGQGSRSTAHGASGTVAIQLDFAEERKLAGDLAYAARNAEKKGDLGECLARWAELLNAFPFEADLVQEAETKRAALVQQGLSELQAVRAETERARFFRLVDLYRQCRRKAQDVGARFHGSEVEAEAQKVIQEVDGHLAGFEADLARAERGRLQAILAGLEARHADGLAARVREHLEALPEPPAGGPPAGQGTED